MTSRLLTTWITIQAWVADRIRNPKHDERGSVTVEQAVITAALVLIALAVVAAIGAYVQSKIATLA